mgnify:CR=1 FL=1
MILDNVELIEPIIAKGRLNIWNYQGDYKIWQICENGKVDGIDGAVDIDIMTN